MLGLSAGATVVEPFEASMKTLPSGTRLGDRGGGDLAVGAGAVLDHHRALQPLGDAGCHDAGQKVVGSARRKADDEAQRPVGKIRRLGAGGQAGGQKRQGRKSGECGTAAEQGHRRLW